jgi:glycosyltransferase involved in cell wall biosynthesis
LRILWHSSAPWTPTGYGTQTAIWCRYLRDRGHDIAISTYYGSPGKTRRWEGITVYPPPQDGDVTSLIMGHARAHKAEMIIILADVWLMDARALAGLPVYAWVPVDTSPLSLGDTLFLRAGDVRPVAMSEHGAKMLAAAGYPDVPLIPHAIDTSLFSPDPRRDELRAAFGIRPAEFAIGMNFNNIDPVRKATPEQMAAFSRFRKRHPDSTLFMHSMLALPRSLDLRVLARTLGIEDAVRFADQYRLQSGGYSAADMARWYSAMDIVSNATYGEGFGIPAVEAQACGTPVVLSDNTTGPQLVGPGWLAPCEPFWNNTHGAWWGRPSVDGLVKCYEKAAANRSPFKAEACRLLAEKYDIAQVGPLWEQLLDVSR